MLSIINRSINIKTTVGHAWVMGSYYALTHTPNSKNNNNNNNNIKKKRWATPPGPPPTTGTTTPTATTNNNNHQEYAFLLQPCYPGGAP
jgi:hypothetical protein